MIDNSGMTETSVSSQGPLGQIGSLIKGLFVGLICFIAAFPVLYCGATRIQWQKVFKDAVPVEQTTAGKPAYVTGIATAERIGDPPNIPAGNYLKISKTPEVYAWVEHKKTESKTEREGISRKKKTTTTKTYSYTMEWTSSPEAISSFNSEKWQTFCRNNNINTNVQNPLREEDSE